MAAQAPLVNLDQLSATAAAALKRGDAAAARRLFERLLASRPQDLGAWIGLATACGGLGDVRAQLAALDRVLAANPGHPAALTMKADHFAAAKDRRSAHAFYKAAVDRAPGQGALSPEGRLEIDRAARLASAYERAYEDHLTAAVSGAGFDPARTSPRFVRSMDLLLGKAQLYPQAPTAFYFPELPQRQFFERDEFPWLPALEAQSGAIRDELLALVDEAGAFRPYVEKNDRRPPKEYGDLLDNPGWSAFFLIKAGEEIASAAARCPATMRALREVPLSAASGRTPSVLFSLLRPGVRIPPHHGELNTRLICHLPLITPAGCGLRVGSETRSWRFGETLIFDDSIEHGAWNTSGAVRVVLLFEVWRPELTAEERRLIAAALAAVGDYDAAP